MDWKVEQTRGLKALLQLLHRCRANGLEWKCPADLGQKGKVLCQKWLESHPLNGGLWWIVGLNG